MEGKGQFKNLRNNKNLKNVDIEDLLQKTPRKLEEMFKNGDIISKTLKQLKKPFEGRDLGNKGRGN